MLSRRTKAFGAGLFAISMFCVGVFGVLAPRLAPGRSLESWMLIGLLSSGLVAVATVPLAWRWLYQR